jgi:sec-independent protein translocase protein TatC
LNILIWREKMGISAISSDLLKKKRKYVIPIIFILSAVITPPDLFTLLIIAVPLWVLYELSILGVNKWNEEPCGK